MGDARARRRTRRGARQLITRTFVVLLAVATAVFGLAPAASAAPTWSMTPSPNPSAPPSASMSAMDCPTATSCHMVGHNGSLNLAAARWNGTAWSLVPIESPSASSDPGLVDLSCATASDCFAVGSVETSTAPQFPLMERWNGTSWSIVAAPQPASATDARLLSVSCVTTSFCLATGQYTVGSADVPYAARWNGATWTIVSIPAPATSQQYSIASVSCVTSTMCIAAGGWHPSGSTYDRTLVERWNGTSWAVAGSPTPANVAQASWDDVSCPSATFCFAVGTYNSGGGHRPFAGRWNGATWTLISTSIPGGVDNMFPSVACASSTRCFSAGFSYSYSSGIRPWIKRWDGSTWATVTVANAGPNSEASTVACATATTCFAAGTVFPTNDSVFVSNVLTLLERWDASTSTWKIASPPPGGAQSGLLGVTCTSTSFCVAVGSSTPAATRALVEHWNGASWSVVPAPSPTGSVTSTLQDVACSGPANCFAVGWYRIASGTDRLLIEQWNGSTWSIVPTGTTAGRLGGIACPSATRCVTVGDGDVWMWDGASWSVDASGTTTAGGLGDVSCSSATSCFAVGAKGKCCSSQTTFIRRWDAGSWFTVPSPTPPNSGYTALRSVSCTAWNACTAVGDTSNNAAAPLIERWNGTAWSIVAGASTGDYTSLSSVSCSSSTSCVAVGVSNGALIEQWDGSTWTIVPTAHRPGATFDYLWGVSCLSSTACFATGYAHSSLYNFTFAERSA